MGAPSSSRQGREAEQANLEKLQDGDSEDQFVVKESSLRGALVFGCVHILGHTSQNGMLTSTLSRKAKLSPGGLK